MIPRSIYSTGGSFLKLPQTKDAIAAYVRAYTPIVEDPWPNTWIVVLVVEQR